MTGMLSPAQVLARFRPHDGTIASMLAARVARLPQHPFVEYQGEVLTFAEVQDAARRTAAVFAAQGVRPGDRIGMMSANHPQIVIGFYALAQLGATMVPVNPDYGPAEAGYVLGHAQVCGVVCAPAALERVRAALAALDGAQQPWLMLTAPGESGLPVLAQRAAAAAPRLEAEGDADAACVMIYTSGTTGFPKGVMHSQRSLLTAGEGFVVRMHLQPEDRLLCVLPLFHINAIFYSLTGALAAGATLVLEPGFSATAFWRRASQTGATVVNTIAAINSILIRRPRSEYVPDHRLRKMYGAPFDAETYRVFQQEFGVPTLIEGFGMSEIPGVLNNPFEGPHRIGSMGKPTPQPDGGPPLAQLRIVDDEGRDVPDGEVGELLVKTPIVMLGYFRDPEQTAAALRDGWFQTGDLAWRDADGYYWFVARKKDIIRRRGENISGAELDRVIGAHPSVLEAAAIPVPSELGEDDILVAVVPRPHATVVPQEIAQWCRAHLAQHKVPRYLTVVESLPHTPTHRVAKFKMREDASLRERAVELIG